MRAWMRVNAGEWMRENAGEWMCGFGVRSGQGGTRAERDQKRVLSPPGVGVRRVCMCAGMRVVCSVRLGWH
jgi:hypothetical protein